MEFTTAYQCGHTAPVVTYHGTVRGAPPLCQFCAEEQVRRVSTETPDELRQALASFIGNAEAERTVSFCIGAITDRLLDME